MVGKETRMKMETDIERRELITVVKGICIATGVIEAFPSTLD